MRFLLLFSLVLGICTLKADEIPITLEIAKTPEERCWGLMKRSFMPDDHGMLFYTPSGYIWMFNTWLDLSIAFLDGNGNIIAIAELKAYPERMDPLRPVNQVKDMNKYPFHDQVYQFFWSKRYRVPERAKFALEMNKQWFERHQVKVGDKVLWQEGSPQATVKQR